MQEKKHYAPRINPGALRRYFGKLLYISTVYGVAREYPLGYRWLPGIFSLVLPLLAVRIVLYFQLIDASALLYLFRGICSDVLVSIIIFYSLPFLRVTSILIPFIFIWCYLAAANWEYIIVNNLNLDIRLLSLSLSKDFIMGSALSYNLIIKFIFLSFLSCSVLFKPFNLSIGIVVEYKKTTIIALFISCLTVVLLLNAKASMPAWLQMSLIEENVRGLVASSPLAKKDKEYVIDDSIIDMFLRYDISGEPLFEFPEKKYNILVVIIEGISMKHINALNAPNLNRIASNSLKIDNFVGLRRQTNRGLYSLFCGNYPNLVSIESKSDIIGVYGQDNGCLPERLYSSGYRTVFMQSAELGFMRKDLFAKKAGFEEYYGKNDYDLITPFHWGHDDKSFYKVALNKIKQLNKESTKPWMLTLLTIGTHQPFHVPGKTRASFEEALGYADESIEFLYEKLKRERTLENTILVITSDEASGFTSKNPVSRVGLLPMIVLIPGMEGVTQDDNGIFSQLDFQSSIMDLLSIECDNCVGRSFFRKYKSMGRHLFASYSNSLFYISGESVYVCNFKGDCDAYLRTNGTTFGGVYRSVGTEYEVVDRIFSFIKYNELKGESFGSMKYKEKDKVYSGNANIFGNSEYPVNIGDVVAFKITIDNSLDDSRGLLSVYIRARNEAELGIYNILYGIIDDIYLFPGQKLNYYRQFEVKEEYEKLLAMLSVTSTNNTLWKLNYASVDIQKKHTPSLSQKKEIIGVPRGYFVDLLPKSNINMQDCLIESFNSNNPIYMERCKGNKFLLSGPTQPVKIYKSWNATIKYNVRQIKGNTKFTNLLIYQDEKKTHEIDSFSTSSNDSVKRYRRNLEMEEDSILRFGIKADAIEPSVLFLEDAYIFVSP